MTERKCLVALLDDEEVRGYALRAFIWERFLQTYISRDVEEIWESVFVMCNLFEEIAREMEKCWRCRYNAEEAIASYGFLKYVRTLPKEAEEINPGRLHLVSVADGEQRAINGRNVTFFDIGSTKAKQFGFSMELDGRKHLVCCGDEPYNACEEIYAKGCEWLLHEAFCLHSQADIFVPYDKHHSTVKDACQLAEKLEVRNLVLYHTEDKNIHDRKRLYKAEGERCFSGNLYIPDDLETIVI